MYTGPGQQLGPPWVVYNLAELCALLPLRILLFQLVSGNKPRIMNFDIIVAADSHIKYATEISSLIKKASAQRGTGIANRTPAYIEQKIHSGQAIIALEQDQLAGFCYIETWDHHRFVANSGLIVSEDYRHQGLAFKIKKKAFELSRKKYPEAKLFGITTSLPVMKINSTLGYQPVTFSELTNDSTFWDGCQGCKNHDILVRNEQNMCLCTAMLFMPENEIPKNPNNKLKRWNKFLSFLKVRAKRIKKYDLEKNA
jgi:hypothetical protein